MVMVGEACEAVVSHGLLRQGGGGSGGAGCDGGVSETAGSSSSLFSSTSSQLTDEEDGDGATSSFPPGRGVSSSSLSSLTSSGLETMQMDGAAGGPLYELSTMLDHLPALRTGLSKYYQGRSQSFTSLVDVSCVEDLAKKIAPYTRRMKASRGYTAALGVKDRLSRTIAKKAQGLRRAGCCREQGAQVSCAATANHLQTRARERCKDARSRQNVGSCKMKRDEMRSTADEL